ncbi:MAG: CDP-glycerol glycerophosphotransferase family protein [Lachnospiraceae bacterium]|nr:CDP-glycerol glycerophosphotransferase family protein [Lachnospiraceae bacterium]
MKKILKYLWMYISCLFPRDKSLVVFGAWLGERFCDNSMQLFLEASKVSGLKCVWITKSKKVYKQVKKLGLKCELWGTKKARKYQQKAGYAVISNGISDLEHTYLGGAVILDLWHGIPLKKIAFDNDLDKNHDSLKQRVKRFFKYAPLSKIYYFAPSENFREIYKSAFRKEDKYIITLGQPRNDVFFGENKPKPYFKGKRVILYCPTHRREGNIKFDLKSIFDLDRLNKFLENRDYYFMVKKHFYHKDEDETEVLEKYDRIIDITAGDYDIQRLCMECEMLITDYSSIYIDYLLLDKPVIFYCYDYDDYIKNDRGMYFPYESVTPGDKAYNFDELMGALEECDERGRKYQENEREALKDFFYCSAGQKSMGHRIIGLMLNQKL